MIKSTHTVTSHHTYEFQWPSSGIVIWGIYNNTGLPHSQTENAAQVSGNIRVKTRYLCNVITKLYRWDDYLCLSDMFKGRREHKNMTRFYVFRYHWPELFEWCLGLRHRRLCRPQLKHRDPDSELEATSCDSYLILITYVVLLPVARRCVLRWCLLNVL